jgi:hypothetical protein
VDPDVDHVTPSPIQLNVSEGIDVFVLESLGEPQQNTPLEVGCHISLDDMEMSFAH